MLLPSVCPGPSRWCRGTLLSTTKAKGHFDFVHDSPALLGLRSDIVHEWEWGVHQGGIGIRGIRRHRFTGMARSGADGGGLSGGRRSLPFTVSTQILLRRRAISAAPQCP